MAIQNMLCIVRHVLYCHFSVPFNRQHVLKCHNKLAFLLTVYVFGFCFSTLANHPCFIVSFVVVCCVLFYEM